MDILNLGKSKIRRDILKLYFGNPEGSYFVRELGRLLKQPAAYMWREMVKLEKSGLFVSHFRGQERYFSLQKDYPLYKEIESIFFKTMGTGNDLKVKTNKGKR